MSVERRRDNRRRGVPGSHTSTVVDPAQNERFGLYGIPKRKKFATNLPKVGEHEVCIPKPRILV